MSKKSSNKNGSVKILPISRIIFMSLAIIALIIMIGKGKIGAYSLVKIETSTDSEAPEVIEEPEDVLEISVDQKYLAVKSKTKETATATVTLNGEEIDLSEVELESSNENVLKVDETGIIKPVSVGKATITATKDDLTASVDLRAITPITSINFTATNSVIRVGKSLQMKLVAKPSDASIETLKYTSSDEDIATVNNNGIVTGVSKGKVKITVTDAYTGVEKSVNLTIK